MSPMENVALEALLFASKQVTGHNAFAVLLQDEGQAVSFFSQLFQQRYGWSETTDVVDGMDSNDVQERKQRNEQLDVIISQIQDLTISGSLLACFANCISAARQMPVVKEHTFHHFFTWVSNIVDIVWDCANLKGGSMPHSRPRVGLQAFLLSKDGIGEEMPETLVAHFDAVRGLIVKGLTDVWSVIRKQSANRVRGFSERLPMPLVKELFQTLVAICNKEGSSWQEVEGALLGMNAIMRNFKWEEFGEGDTPTSPISPSPHPSGPTPCSLPVAPSSSTTSPQRQVRVAWSPGAQSGPGRLTSLVSISHPQLSPFSEDGTALPADPLGFQPAIPFRRRAHSDPWLLATGNKRRRYQKELERKARNKKLLWLAFEGERFDEEAMDAKPSIPATPADDEQNPTMRYLRFGTHKFSFLPLYIADGLMTVLYRMLAHPQLSVRDVASRLICNLLSRSQFSETVLSFKHVIQHLRGSDLLDAGSAPLEAGCRPLLGAFEAEGFIRLASMLVRKLPPEYLVSNWEKYSPVLDAYLAHPACTVRQETSRIYHLLVMKDADNPCMPLCRRTLSALIGDWQPTTSASAPSAPLDRQLSPEAPTDSVCWALLSSSWQWREGRLLAYELILDHLVSQHIDAAFPPPALPDNTASPLSSPNASDCPAPLPAFLPPAQGSTPPSSAAHPKALRSWNPSDSVKLAQVSPGSAHPLSKTVSFFTLRNMSVPHSHPPMDRPEGISMIDRLLVCLQQEENLRRSSCDLSGSSHLGPCPPTSSPMQGARPESSPEARMQDVGQQLRTVLLQSLESSLEGQWELQRMARQVVPLCVEAIFYYDVDLLLSALELFLREEEDDPNSSAVAQGCILLRHATWKAVVVDYCVANYVNLHGPPHHWWAPLHGSLSRAQAAVRQFRCGFACLLPRALHLGLGRTGQQAAFDVYHALLIAGSYLRLPPEEVACAEELVLSDPMLAEFPLLCSKAEEGVAVATGPDGPDATHTSRQGCTGPPQSWRNNRPPPLSRHSSSALTCHSLSSSPHESPLGRPAGFYLKAVLHRLLEMAGGKGGLHCARASTWWSGSTSSLNASLSGSRQLFTGQLAQEMANLFPDLVLEASLEEMSLLLQLHAALLRVRDEVHIQNLLLEAVRRIYHFLGVYLWNCVRAACGKRWVEDPGFVPFSFVTDPTLASPTVTEMELHANSTGMLRMAVSVRQKVDAAGQTEGALHGPPRPRLRIPPRYLRPESVHSDAVDGQIDRCASSPPSRETTYREQLPPPPCLVETSTQDPSASAPLLPVGELAQRSEAVLAELLPLLARRTLEISITHRALEVLKGAFLLMGDLRFLPSTLDCFHARLTSEKPSVFEVHKKLDDAPGPQGAAIASPSEEDSDWDSDGGSWDECTGEFDRLASELTQFAGFLLDHFSAEAQTEEHVQLVFGIAGSHARRFLGVPSSDWNGLQLEHCIGQLSDSQRTVLQWLQGRVPLVEE